jgi:hypothetical protein
MRSGLQPHRVAIIAAFAAALAFVGTVAAAPIDIESQDLGVRFAVPEHCSAMEGPGTLEAICDPSGDATKSAPVATAAALKLEIIMQPTPENKGEPPDVLAARYSFGQFQKDVPAAVCGDEARVKIEDAMQLFEGALVVYTANVLCPEIRFLGLGQRRAVVRTIVRPDRQYQVAARALASDFERLKPAIDAFFASLRIGEPEKSP